MFAKSEDLYRHTLAGDFLQWLFECLTIGGSHQHAGQPLAAPECDVVEHVTVDVAVFVDLRFGEDREPHVTQSLHPRSNNIGATWGDVREHRRLRLKCEVGPGTRQLGGARQQPAAERVEPGPVGGGGPATEDRAEAHVQVGCVPHQQHPRRRLGRHRRGRGYSFYLWFYALDVFSEAHGCFSQSNSATALPAWCALPSYFV